jgi:hypothetical protein
MPGLPFHPGFDNRSLTVAALNERFRAARVSKRYRGRETSTTDGKTADRKNGGLRYERGSNEIVATMDAAGGA